MAKRPVPMPNYDPSMRFTKQELMEVSGLSSKTFDMIRKAARVKGPIHGALSWEFTADELAILVLRAESGTFTERGGPAGVAWRRLLAGEDLSAKSPEEDE
jgi:hypothetical protein